MSNKKSLIHGQKNDVFVGDELQSKDLSEQPDGIFTNDLLISDEDLEEEDKTYNPKPFRDIILHDYTYPGKADTRMGSNQEMISKIADQILKQALSQRQTIQDARLTLLNLAKSMSHESPILHELKKVIKALLNLELRA